MEIWEKLSRTRSESRGRETNLVINLAARNRHISKSIFNQFRPLKDFYDFDYYRLRLKLSQSAAVYTVHGRLVLYENNMVHGTEFDIRTDANREKAGYQAIHSLNTG